MKTNILTINSAYMLFSLPKPDNCLIKREIGNVF